MKEEHCELCYHDEKKVKHASDMLEKENISSVAKMFKALADETRLKIAYALYTEKELCVRDVASIIHSSIATASHHLRLLQTIGLAKKRKEGKLVFYSLDDSHVNGLIKLAFSHSSEMKHKDLDM
ncbi:ArsR/SmtB family transcription factor [Bacillus sp. M5A3_1b]